MKASDREPRAVTDGAHLHVSHTRLWQCACESFMGGVLHSIGSRLSALSGIATMAGMGKELDGTLLSLLEDEVECLTDVLDASRALPRSLGPVSGPTQVADLLPRIVRLVELSLDARGVDLQYEGVEDGADVQLDRVTVTHSLATLLACLLWRSRRNGAGELWARLTADGDQVEVRAELRAFSESTASAHAIDLSAQPPDWVFVEGLASIAYTATACGGSLEVDGDIPPSSFAVRLPKLG